MILRKNDKVINIEQIRIMEEKMDFNQNNNNNNEYRKLYKSRNRMLCGVCGGIGEYLNLDPTVIRLLWIIFSFVGGCGILAYIIAAIVIPEY